MTLNTIFSKCNSVGLVSSFCLIPYIGIVVLIPHMIHNGIDPYNNSGIQKFSHFHIPTKILMFDWNWNLIPRARLVDVTVDVECWYHAYTRPPLHIKKNPKQLLVFLDDALIIDMHANDTCTLGCASCLWWGSDFVKYHRGCCVSSLLVLGCSFHMGFKIVITALNWIFYNYPTLIKCFVSYEKWTIRKILTI